MSKPSRDPIGAIRGLVARKKAQEGALRRNFAELEARLKGSLEDGGAWGQSDNCTLAEYGDGESVYGHIFYSGSGLSVANRTTEEDLHQAISNDHSPATYSITHVAECPVSWLVAVGGKDILESLFADIQRRLTEQTRSSAAVAEVLANTAHAPVQDLDSSLQSAANALDYNRIVDEWRRAQAAVSIDTAEAATRSCTLLESLLKHMLSALQAEPPADQSVRPLFKSVSRLLALSPDKQTSDHLVQIASGVVTIVHGIGSLRSHVGSAHGRGPGARAASVEEARFAVNISGSLATYLMGELLSKRNEPSFRAPGG